MGKLNEFFFSFCNKESYLLKFSVLMYLNVLKFGFKKFLIKIEKFLKLRWWSEERLGSEFEIMWIEVCLREFDYFVDMELLVIFKEKNLDV